MKITSTIVKRISYCLPFLFMMIGFISCSPRLMPVKIVSIDGMNMKEFFTKPDLTLNINLNNPNHVGFTMKQISFDVIVNDKVVASVNEGRKFRIKRKSDFTFPLSVKTSGDISSYMDLGMDLFSNKKLTLGVKGMITAHKFIFNIKVPVDLTTNEFKF